MVVKLLWAIKYSKPTFNQRTYGIWLSTVNFLYHGEMQLQSSSSTDELQSCGLSTNNKFLRGTPGPSMVVIYWVPVFIYLYIFDNKTLLHSKPVKAVPVRISLLGIRTNSCDLIKYLSALQLFLHNSICLHKRPLVHWIKVRSDTKMEVIPILVKAVSICLLLFTESLKQSLFIYSSLLRVFWDKVLLENSLVGEL